MKKNIFNFFYLIILITHINLHSQIEFGKNDGELDPTFGLNGLATTLIGISSQATCVAIQTDQKVIVGGFSSNTSRRFFSVARYNTDGTLDSTTFNPSGAGSFIPGVVSTDLGGNAQITSIAIQTDSKIVVGGYVYNVNTQSNNLVIGRYNTDGSLDTTFNPLGTGLGIPGIVNSVIDNSSQVNSILLQSDGKILAGGFTSEGQINIGTIVRYNTDGSLDTSFNSAGETPGFADTILGNSSLSYNSIALQSDGKILAGGSVFLSEPNISYFAIVRYNPNGTLDTTFNPSGMFSFLPSAVVTKFNGSASINSIKILPNGKILAGGSVKLNGLQVQIAIAKYNENGSLDYTFNPTAPIAPITSRSIPPIVQRGAITTTISSTTLSPINIGIKDDGKIVATASVTLNDLNKGALIRYHSDGSIDPTFNPTELGVGFILTPGIGFSQVNLSSINNALAVLADDKLMVVGATFVNNITSAFLVQRYFFQQPFMNLDFTNDFVDQLNIISGLTKGNENISLIIDGKNYKTTTADLTGYWSIVLAGLPLGTHTGQAVTFGASKTFTFTTNKALPKLFIINPSSASEINSIDTITGTTDPNLTVNLSIDGNNIGSTQANDLGNWEFTTTPVADGAHHITAQVQNGAGKTSRVSNIFEIDSLVPDFRITFPTNNSTLENLTSVRGTTDALSTVIVYIDGVIANFDVVRSSGTWAVILPPKFRLTKGFHIISALSRNQFGNIARQTSFINLNYPTSVTIETPANGSTINTRTPIISGTKESGSSVVVKDRSTLIGQVAANSSTKWSFQSSILSESLHTIIATATDNVGNIAQAESTFTITTKTSIKIDNPINGSTIHNSTPIISGTKNIGASVVVKNGSTIIGKIAANASTTWSIKSSILSEGKHTITAIATDTIGNTATAKTTFIVNANTKDVIITSPAKGSTVSAPLVVRGSAQPGSKLVIQITNVHTGKKISGSLTVNVNGLWSYQPNQVTLGKNIVTVTAKAPSGIVSTASAAFTLVASNNNNNNNSCSC
ncbi:MAG: Ig-like domain-containing protein [Candidatus Babeliales bacterium]|nr:Ig-like domain-containing protein [Candidatus Babeliales bacterium]